jgi:hypothetical protein
MSRDTIWKHILQQIAFNPQVPIHLITSSQIKACQSTWTGPANQFEPRLLCKMDTSSSRPSVFQEYNLCLLSVKNGTYALLGRNIYVPLPKFEMIPQKINKSHSSLILDIGQSETSMLDNLLHNKVLDAVIGEPVLYGPLLGGRHRCSFTTELDGHTLQIQGSQYETDGCYETENYVCLVEAKSVPCVDFNIRQLYYPFREVHKKVGDTKQIIALFIYIDKQKIIHIHKYKWGDYQKMMDIYHLNYYCFRT